MQRTFATALLTASAVATDLPATGLTFGAMSIPDYVAGLIFGLTGDNNLEELQSCFHVTSDIETQAKLVVSDFAEAHIIHALEDLGSLASMLPPALSTCEGMQDDF